MSVFWSFPSKGLNSSPIFVPIRFLSHLFLPNSGILALFLWALEFWSYPSKHWNSCPIFINISILALFFQTLELLSFSFKHCNTDPIFIKIGILALSSETLEFWSYSFKDWNSGLTVILEFCPYFYTHLFSDLILQNGEILASFV